ncbi:MAG: class I SAM-dependent methyltransferase [Eubacteriales bacterium]|nr:class I SAM-dependent methyltransferase [Eubacteriales bacterium]
MNRIDEIVSLCDNTNTIIDIGTDHGYTIIELIKKNKAKEYIATDINEKPLNIARNNILPYNKNVKYILTNGLESIKINKEYGIIITGMGGFTIINILKNIEQYNFKYLIISPHSDIDLFKHFIYSKGLYIEKEIIIYEKGIFYFLFKCLKGKREYKKYANNLFLYPYNKIFKLFLNKEIKRIKKILEKIKDNDNKFKKMEDELIENQRYITLLR